MKKILLVALASVALAVQGIAQIQLSHANNPLGGNWESSVSFSVHGTGTIPDDWYIAFLIQLP